MNCKICQHNSSLLFETKVLRKYNVQYYQCEKCGFIQTEQPYWLDEAYSSVITNLDIGLTSRNIDLANQLYPILVKYFDSNAKYLDYGGGYGMFVRLMRDKGIHFYRQDIYCDNLFAKHFDITDLPLGEHKNFELLTAFEVFEHLEDPISEIKNMFNYSSSVLFSTTLQPETPIKNVNDWWYFIPETGQHVSLYSLNSLRELAKKFNKKLYTNSNTLHLLTDKKLPDNVLQPTLLQKVVNRLTNRNKKSLQQADFNYIKSKTNS